MNSSTIVKYPLSIRIFHWVVTVFVLTMITVGYVMSGMEASPQKWQIYFMHKSSGLLLFIIIIARLINRYTAKIPIMPAPILKFEAKAAKLNHFLMYALLLLIPIAGALMSISGGNGLPFFVTSFFEGVERNKEISSFFWIIHTKLPVILLILISLHILGAFKHLLIDKYNIFKRII